MSIFSLDGVAVARVGFPYCIPGTTLTVTRYTSEKNEFWEVDEAHKVFRKCVDLGVQLAPWRPLPG